MKNTERRMLYGVIVAALVLVIIMAGFIFWQNFLWGGANDTSKQTESNQVSLDFMEGTGLKTVTSTLDGWPVSLEVPSMWKAEVDYTTFYNYDTRQKEVATVVTIIHPTKKVHIVLWHYPFFSADGPCGASTVQHLSKESMLDDRLMFVEAASEGAFFLSATTKEAASAITEDFNGCFNYRNLINYEGKGVVLSTDEALPHYKKPFVSVGIRPAFTSEGERPSWDYQMMSDFLKTEEYLEAKEIVKKLKI